MRWRGVRYTRHADWHPNQWPMTQYWERDGDVSIIIVTGANTRDSAGGLPPASRMTRA